MLYFPWWVLIILAIIAWFTLAAMHYQWRLKISNYFAGRRAMRRLRNYARSDAQMTMELYSKPYGRHKKKVTN